MIVTVAMMWFRRNLALRKKKAASKFSCFNNNKHRKRRYIQRSPKVLKNYQESNWAQMLQLGRCQDPSSKDGKLFLLKHENLEAAFFFLNAKFLRNHIMATVTIIVQFCSKLWTLETFESVVLYCTYMHPYIYTVSRTTVQLLHRM